MRALLQSCVSETVQPPTTHGRGQQEEEQEDGAVSAERLTLLIYTLARLAPSHTAADPVRELPSKQGRLPGLASVPWSLVPSLILRRRRFTRAGKWSGYTDSTCLSASGSVTYLLLLAYNIAVAFVLHCRCQIGVPYFDRLSEARLGSGRL